MTTPEEVAQLRESLLPPVELEALAGLSEWESLRATIEDVVQNSASDIAEEAEADLVAMGLIASIEARAKELFDAREREEASWSASTANDRIEAAFRELATTGIVFNVRHLVHAGSHREPLGDFEGPDDATWAVDWELSRSKDGGVEGRGCADKPMVSEANLPTAGDAAALAAARPHFEIVRERLEKMKQEADEIVRVLRHYEVEGIWDAANGTLTIGPFPWQKRRTTKAPSILPPAPTRPSAPPVCALCGGKGWRIPSDPSHFAERCVCKGGESVAPPVSAPPPPVSAPPPPVSATSVPPPVTFTPRAAERSRILLQATLVAALVFLAGFYWKHVPLGWAILSAGLGFVVSGAVPLVQSVDTLEISAEGVSCRKKSSWHLPFDRIFRVYRLGDRWIFETHQPHRRVEFRLRGHEAHIAEIVAALEHRTKMLNLEWAQHVALSRLL